MKHIIKHFIQRIYLWSIRKKFPYWWIGVHCNHCGRDVFKRKADYFMLKPEVWEKVVDNPYTSTYHILCKRCTERLLGRKLTQDDYYQPEDEDPNHGNYV